MLPALGPPVSLVHSTVPISPFGFPKLPKPSTRSPDSIFAQYRMAHRVAGFWHGLILGLHPGVTAAAENPYAIFALLSSRGRAAFMFSWRS